MKNKKIRLSNMMVEFFIIGCLSKGTISIVMCYRCFVSLHRYISSLEPPFLIFKIWSEIKPISPIPPKISHGVYIPFKLDVKDVPV